MPNLVPPTLATGVLFRPQSISMHPVGLEPTTFGSEVVRYRVSPVFCVPPCCKFAQFIHGVTSPLVSNVGVKFAMQCADRQVQLHGTVLCIHDNYSLLSRRVRFDRIPQAFNAIRNGLERRGCWLLRNEPIRLTSQPRMLRFRPAWHMLRSVFRHISDQRD